MQLKERLKQKTLKRVVIILLFITIIFVFQGSIIWVVKQFQKPLAITGSWASEQTAYVFRNPDSLQIRINDLENRILGLVIDKTQYEQLLEENKQLRQQVGFLESQKFSYLSTRILGSSNSLQVRRFIIGIGENDGVHINAPVVIGEGVLVGKVISTTKTTATVSMLSDPGSMTAVTLLNRTRTLGLAEGESGTLLRIKFIPHDEIVLVNDLVITSGLENDVPPGLLVGIVNTIQSDESEPFQEAIVESIIDVRRHNVVSVLIK
ncbi:MAG: rod shape-determining protein MreC [Patescibacteria group bacterium]